MNLPNKLTMLRVILVPVFMVFAAYSRYGTADFNPTFALIAGIIFAVASFTDFLDGYLARKNNLVTDFGKFTSSKVTSITLDADTIFGFTSENRTDFHFLDTSSDNLSSNCFIHAFFGRSQNFTGNRI